LAINNFIRFTESIKTKEDMRVVRITIRPLIADCTGEVYFTDLQLQEGNRLTGHTPHTTTMLRNSAPPPASQRRGAHRRHRRHFQPRENLLGLGLLYLPDSSDAGRKYFTFARCGIAQGDLSIGGKCR